MVDWNAGILPAWPSLGIVRIAVAVAKQQTVSVIHSFGRIFDNSEPELGTRNDYLGIGCSKFARP
jgi:hypothetical protein